MWRFSNENRKMGLLDLTFICPYIANIFSENNQEDETLLKLFISVRRSTCFRPKPDAVCAVLSP